jgi:pyruvate/2-oxoglutarate dehydrogenase complex dihydrolipoamide acyltransferase (E2) component
MAVEILLPRLTDTMHQGMISFWYKKEGEFVQQGEPLFVVETDKASVEVDASATGILLKILVNEGESVEVEGRVAIVGESGEDIQPLLRAIKSKEEKRKEISWREEESPSVKIKASPAAKRRAKEENLDLKEVAGTGENGLITEKDVMEYLDKKRKLSDTIMKYGPEEIVTLEGVRRIMAERMALSSKIPQVTTVAETDVSDLIETSRDTSITITSFIIRAVVEELRFYPLINASLDAEKVILKKYYNIGVSVATPRGLIVPVLHNAEGKDIYQISMELGFLAKKARENQLSLEEVSGRTFTVTNSGVFGSLFFTPRINPPESAVLGMGKIMKQPVVRREEITIRSMMYLSLSYDHRIIDGETAVKFLQEVKKLLESPRNLLRKSDAEGGENSKVRLERS